MVVQGVRRHALIDVIVIVWDFDFARELDVIVLFVTLAPGLALKG